MTRFVIITFSIIHIYQFRNLSYINFTRNPLTERNLLSLFIYWVYLSSPFTEQVHLLSIEKSFPCHKIYRFYNMYTRRRERNRRRSIRGVISGKLECLSHIVYHISAHILRYSSVYRGFFSFFFTCYDAWLVYLP